MSEPNPFTVLASELVSELRAEVRGFRSDARRLETRINSLEKSLAVHTAVTEVQDVTALRKRIESLERWRYGVILASGVVMAIVGMLVKFL